MNEKWERIRDDAATWHLASLRDDMDWNGFTQWLEADPLHARVYEEVSLADDLAARIGPSIANDFIEVPEDASRKPRWPLWAGGAIAASLALVFAVGEMQGPDPIVYSAGRSSRTVTLADGSRITLAPDSSITMNGKDANELTLKGSGYFAIRHNPTRQLTIAAGHLEVADIGTEFDILTGAGTTRVGVAKGSVAVRSDNLAAPVTLRAGKRLVYDAEAHSATIRAISLDQVGDWRNGRLSYADAKLAVVAADLSRYAGRPIIVTPSLADRRFSGTLAIGNGGSAIQDLAQLMGLVAVRDGAAYRLEPAR